MSVKTSPRRAARKAALVVERTLPDAYVAQALYKLTEQRPSVTVKIYR